MMGRPKIPFSREFRTQKQNARRRGIPFEFDYQSWINWWGEDIVQRGKGKGTLVMARKNDQGSYNIDNVIKLTNEKNLSDGNINKIVSNETRSKLSALQLKRWAKQKELL